MLYRSGDPGSRLARIAIHHCHRQLLHRDWSKPLKRQPQMYRIAIFAAFLLPVVLFSCNSGDEKTSLPKEPPLVLAAEQGRADEVGRLLSIDPNADIRDACAWTPLMKAALYGHNEAAAALLQAGADPDAVDKGAYTPLLLAASNNHAETVGILLDAGADADHRENTEGMTALIWAAKRGHTEAVRRLLAAGARTDLTDNSGKTALDRAREKGDALIVALLQDTSQPR